jgi:uncharacterized membrane protein YoaT (DUF817 family)
MEINKVNHCYIGPYYISLGSCIFMQNNDGNFGLSILLGAVFIISFIWLASGIRQYRSISPWSKGYDEYKKENKETDRKLSDSGSVK